MEAPLASLVKIAGVRGAAVFDSTEACIAFDAPAPYHPAIFQSAIRLVGEIVAGTVISGHDEHDLLLAYDEGILAYHGSRDHHVVVVGDASTKPSMVWVGIRMVLARLRRDVRSGEMPALAAVAGMRSAPMMRHDAPPVRHEPAPIRHEPPRREPQAPSSRSGATPLSSPPPDEPSQTFTPSSTFTPISGMQALDRTGSGSAATTNAMLLELRAILESFVGREGRAMLKDEIQRIVGTSGQKAKFNFDEVVALVARRVPSSVRPEFLNKVTLMRRKYP